MFFFKHFKGNLHSFSLSLPLFSYLYFLPFSSHLCIHQKVSDFPSTLFYTPVLFLLTFVLSLCFPSSHLGGTRCFSLDVLLLSSPVGIFTPTYIYSGSLLVLLYLMIFSLSFLLCTRQGLLRLLICKSPFHNTILSTCRSTLLTGFRHVFLYLSICVPFFQPGFPPFCRPTCYFTCLSSCPPTCVPTYLSSGPSCCETHDEGLIFSCTDNLPSILAASRRLS